jgi:hypothetical protein
MEVTKTIASDELLMEQLNNRNWNDFWLKLTARCSWLLQYRYGVNWSTDRRSNFSQTAISEIIDKIFIEKERKWNLDSYPDFEPFILSALDSHVYNTLTKKDLEVEIDDQDEVFNKYHTQLNQSDVIVTAELREEIFDELQKAGADDDELLVFECLADGIDKPETIRAELGLTEQNFHNIWRRLKRRREMVKNKLKKDGY